MSGVYDRSGALLVKLLPETDFDAYICVRDVKTLGTHGGTPVQGWQRRDLNGIQTDTANICSLIDNQVMLPAGTYRFRGACPGYAYQQGNTQLRNVTDSAVLLYGCSEGANYTYTTQNRLICSGMFTISAPKALEFWFYHRGAHTRGDGLGRACSFATEIYTVLEFWKVVD